MKPARGGSARSRGKRHPQEELAAINIEVKEPETLKIKEGTKSSENEHTGNPPGP